MERDVSPEFAAVLRSAARLQQLVPDTVLVGGSAAAFYARHRLSSDHDHALADLALRFDAVLDAVESDGGWATNRITPGKIILGSLDGIETGIRQLIRRRPLEAEDVTLPTGEALRVPTAEEALRIKAFLAVRRNLVRDYLDLAALADLLGLPEAGRTLAAIDDYYADQRAGPEATSTQVARQLADPKPTDAKVIEDLARYKQLAPRWTSWDEVRDVLGTVAAEMVVSGTDGEDGS